MFWVNHTACSSKFQRQFEDHVHVTGLAALQIEQMDTNGCEGNNDWKLTTDYPENQCRDATPSVPSHDEKATTVTQPAVGNSITWFILVLLRGSAILTNLPKLDCSWDSRISRCDIRYSYHFTSITLHYPPRHIQLSPTGAHNTERPYPHVSLTLGCKQVHFTVSSVSHLTSLLGVVYHCLSPRWF